MNTDSFSILYYEYFGKIAVIMKTEDEDYFTLTKLSDEINIDLSKIEESGEYFDWPARRCFYGASGSFFSLCPVLIAIETIK